MFGKLKRLMIRDRFSENLQSCKIPKSLSSIFLPQLYNGALPKFPPTLKSITFGSRFNQVLKCGDIPHGLSFIQFGCRYNKPFNAHSLPNSIKTIIFRGFPKIGNRICTIMDYRNTRSRFNHQIKPDVLPDELLKLVLSDDYSYKIGINSIPNKVTYLELGVGYRYKKPQRCDLPKSIKKVVSYTMIYENSIMKILGVKRNTDNYK